MSAGKTKAIFFCHQVKCGENEQSSWNSKPNRASSKDAPNIEKMAANVDSLHCSPEEDCEADSKEVDADTDSTRGSNIDDETKFVFGDSGDAHARAVLEKLQVHYKEDVNTIWAGFFANLK